MQIPAWPDGGPIPERFAFGKPGEDGPFAFGGNVSPEINWSGAPEGTRSFALVVRDPDVPSSGEDVNQEGKVVPADLPRVDFYHWLLAGIPAALSGLEEGAGSEGITARGKQPGPSTIGISGVNSYTGWFAGDPDMEGTYGGYDGPCPPWNDSIMHHYHFELFALDTEVLDLPEDYTAENLRAAMEGHVLASAAYIGTYSMNPDVQG